VTPAIAAPRPPTPPGGSLRPLTPPGGTARPPAPPTFRSPPPDRVFSKAIEHTPTRPIPVLPFDLLAKAEKALAQGDAETAARSLRAATQKTPSWAPPRLLLGRIYADRGETDLAIAELEIAARADALEPRVHMLLGAVREKRKESELAEDAYRRAIYLEPDYVAARYALAQIYRSTGRTDRARRELRNVVKTLAKKPAAEVARFTDGVSPTALAEMCEKELKALGPG
jgi:tetratricopeptide (TPR) repeat protein